MDPIIKNQLVIFYMNAVELNLLRKSNQRKLIFLLAAFEQGKSPSIKQLPLQIEEKDIKKSLRFADQCMEEALKDINQKAHTGTNKNKLRKLVNEATNQVTERVIDQNKAGLNRLMMSYDVNRLHDNFAKAKLSPGEIQNQSKAQVQELIQMLSKQLEEKIQYKLSLRGLYLNLPLSEKIVRTEVSLKYTHCDFWMYKKRIYQNQRLTLTEKIEQSVGIKSFHRPKSSQKKSLNQLILKEKIDPEAHLRKNLLKQIKQLEQKEKKLQEKLFHLNFKSGEVSENKKLKIKEMQKEIQSFKNEHSRKQPLSKKISQAKYTIKEGYQGPIKVPSNSLLRESQVVR